MAVWWCRRIRAAGLGAACHLEKLLAGGDRVPVVTVIDGHSLAGIIAREVPASHRRHHLGPRGVPGVPITTGGDFARTGGFVVSLVGAGTRTNGVVRCDQPRALDLDAHGGRKLESAPAAVIDEVLAKLAPLFD